MLTRLIALCALALAAPPVATAQNQGEVAVLVGPSPFDLSGTGTGFAAKGTLTLRATRALAIEPALGYFRYEDQFDSDVTILMPEVGLQLRAPSGSVRPYLGVGAGLARTSSNSFSETELSLHAALGARVPIGNAWHLRAEARLRAVDPFTGNMVDLGFGIGRAVF